MATISLLKLTFILCIFCQAFIQNAAAFTIGSQKCRQQQQQNRLLSPLCLSNTATADNKNMEKTWRYVKKPLISIGGRKGVTATHGNSLRQLLEAHTAVKVKVRGLALDDAFAQLAAAAQAAGAPAELELLQSRASDAVVLIGLPGTRQRIEEGTFPPKVEPKPDDGGDDTDDRQPLGIV